ncbi:hypothetical protein H9L10_07030 [Phycicoccus endophyticus]|uniref:Uncharacterized protein n=1 Tax=Phycicoccus endophyticus TaxID=1690220 RepID=A0A7G9R509_9MICO|nr:hypothetical protein [Phycicoccus endophyticus]NHI20924.1 hypothetical protein [Phycicoccus endophyticus]QNN50684.1 hypothetical protein H9L10_07030 [Phycicoccus endophyticus]GGL22306.1 hypothetical protein GCM10012283_00480 [Phycicoccus endophyticus]
MSERWSWSFTGADGGEVTGPPTTTAAFPSQSDAESWLGETWRELATAGVASVTLWHDQQVVYGPMSLEP